MDAIWCSGAVVGLSLADRSGCFHLHDGVHGAGVFLHEKRQLQYVSLQRYLEYPKVTRVKSEMGFYPFPGVTVCNTNPVKKSNIKVGISVGIAQYYIPI